MKKTLVSVMAAVAVIAASDAAQAQMPTTPFSVAIRGGLAFPTGDLEDLGAESGITLGADAEFQFTNMLGVYAGYSFNQFGVEDEEDVDVTDQGFRAGVMASFAAGSISPFVRAGLVMHQLSVSDGETTVDVDDEELGFQVGGGVNIPLGNRLTVAPGATYTTYGIGGDVADEDVSVSHFTVEVALKIRI